MSVADHDPTPQAEHATLVFERDIAAPPERVFQAFADARQRAVWGVPSDTGTVLYDVEDFREDGIDRYRCGPRDDPHIHGTTRYLEIIDNRRIVHCETLASGGRRLSASLTTMELTPAGAGTRLKSTVQLASFIGAAMVDGHRAGNDASLDKLKQILETGG